MHDDMRTLATDERVPAEIREVAQRHVNGGVMGAAPAAAEPAAMDPATVALLVQLLTTFGPKAAAFILSLFRKPAAA